MSRKNNVNEKPRVMFLVRKFPLISETFIINQVADLLERGIDVEVFSFENGDDQFLSSRYSSYRMSERTHYLSMPASKPLRFLHALPRVFRLLLFHPVILIRSLNFVRYGRPALSLRHLYWAAFFVGKNFDLTHCHFGTIGVDFLTIKDLVGLKAPLVTTFYGCDVSAVFKQHPLNIYDRLKHESSLFFVMSNNMKQRVVEYGFPEKKVKVLPVSIDVDSYPFLERKYDSGEPVELVSVGRFVEKKGFDDILRALAVVRRRTKRSFRCSLIGGGELDAYLRQLSSSLGLNDVVEFKGYMKLDDVIQYLLTKHIMIQPSKTAADGDME